MCALSPLPSPPVGNRTAEILCYPKSTGKPQAVLKASPHLLLARLTLELAALVQVPRFGGVCPGRVVTFWLLIPTRRGRKEKSWVKT